MNGEPDNYGPEWARRKIDIPKRFFELQSYLGKWLPELTTGKQKSVLDIGCGPGDLLSLCKEWGHFIQGVDCSPDDSPMGAAYGHLCIEYQKQHGIPVVPSLENLTSGVTYDVINCRGAIEQIGEHAMSGPPHADHHDCRKLNWTAEAIPFLREFIHTCSELLEADGILLIAANGTGETDGWYDEIVRRSGDESGLELVAHDGLLLHKWRKR